MREVYHLEVERNEIRREGRIASFENKPTKQIADKPWTRARVPPKGRKTERPESR